MSYIDISYSTEKKKRAGTSLLAFIATHLIKKMVFDFTICGNSPSDVASPPIICNARGGTLSATILLHSENDKQLTASEKICAILCLLLQKKNLLWYASVICFGYKSLTVFFLLYNEDI